MPEPRFDFGSQWSAQCFICKSFYGTYSTDHRLCQHCVNRYRLHPFFGSVHDLSSCFVSILPDVTGLPEKVADLGFTDIFLGTGDKDLPPGEYLKEVFPKDPQLPCGQPAIIPAKRLASFAGFRTAWILDMSPYIWSGTLKDPRTWAVLAVAVEQNVKDLAVWTAGNAGLSLAKLVHRWNVTRPKQRKTVHCLVDTDAPSEIVVTLRALQCKVAPISTGAGAILTREQIFQVVEAMEGGKAKYWHVTDGWDGVGTFMYSLIARQVLHIIERHLEQVEGFDPQSLYVVVPVGTSNLLLGFCRATESMNSKRPKLVAALPYGDNMLTPFLASGDSNGRPAVRHVPPVAPKLTGFYSPLSPCLWHLTLNRDFGDRDSVEFLEVDRAAQIEAAARVFVLPRNAAVAAEPSALIAFGALKQLGQIIRDHGGKPERSAVLVVNSGFGVMGSEEESFYKESIFALR